MMENHRTIQILPPKEMHFPEGIKWTRQRKVVYEVLWQAREPLNALQIYSKADDMADRDNKFAMSTVYRILYAFEEKGIVNKSTWMGDGTVVYELNRGEHTHYAVCLQCHKKIPLTHCPVVQFSLGEEADDFTVTAHKLELYGYCKACKV